MGKRNWGEKKKQGKKLISLLMKVELVQPFQEIIWHYLLQLKMYFALLLLFSCSVMSDTATPRTAACQASLSFTISQSLLKLTSIEAVMPSNRLVLCCPLLLLPSIFLSIRVFPNELALHIRWLKYWSFIQQAKYFAY